MSSLIKCQRHQNLIKLLTSLNNLNRISTKVISNQLTNDQLNYHNKFGRRFYSSNSTNSQRNDYINNSDYFIRRHIGPTEQEKRAMLDKINFKSIEDLISATIPKRIRFNRSLKLDEPLTEIELISKLKSTCSTNAHEWRSYIGMGYYGCITPPVIQRNILENPGMLTRPF